MILFYGFILLLLNRTLSFLNKNLLLSFVVLICFSFPVTSAVIKEHLLYDRIIVSFLWSIWGVLMILYNRQLLRLYHRYKSDQFLQSTFTLYFDDGCPICSKEVSAIRQRCQLGKVVYEPIEGEEAFKQKTEKITFKQAMKKMHGIDEEGNIYSGIDTLSIMYAKTNLLFLAILLKSPIITWFFEFAYLVWAKLRPSAHKK